MKKKFLLFTLYSKSTFFVIAPIEGSTIDAISLLESTESGQTNRLSETWPIIVGIIIVCIIFAIIALVMYKTGACNKLRFFNDRIEKVEEHRKSLVTSMQPNAMS